MILVTGATGLVGGHLLWHLLQENPRVRAIKRYSSNLQPLRAIFSFYTENPDVWLGKIDWNVADVLDRDALTEALQGVDVVYHCAAVVSLNRGSDIMTDTNVMGTALMVELALKMKVKRFCFVSSIAACGKAPVGEIINESTPWKEREGLSVYARSKYYSEQEAWKGIEKGLNAVIVNPGVILGFSGTVSGSSELFVRVKKGLPFYTKGITGYVNVRDVVRAMILLMNSEVSAERFLLVAENCSNREIINTIATGFGKIKPVFGLNRPVLMFVATVAGLLGRTFKFRPAIDKSIARTATGRTYYDGSKIKTAINFDYSSIEEGIADTCRFILKNKIF
ncbi:MAG: NAD-dependent epimerase/dehydratase family protein [Paludibacter sp.]|nr:NAD-dependent epimerase/dehydratase family protein [Paludibacter sp.]